MFDSSSGGPILKPKLSKRMPSGARRSTSTCSRSDAAVRIRWDRAQPGFCQHQKSWIIDAGHLSRRPAFVGGINLNPHSMVAPGHRGEGQNHDVYIELAGPSAVDVHHNFVQRWNEASERHSADGRWGSGSEIDLPFPTSVPAGAATPSCKSRGRSTAAATATADATPGGAPFDIARGRTIEFRSVSRGIAAARRSIYIEHQHVDVPEIIDCLRQALRRGVEVVAVVPAARQRSLRSWRPWEHSELSPWPASPDWETTDGASPSGFTPSSWSSMANGVPSARATCIATRSSATPS